MIDTLNFLLSEWYWLLGTGFAASMSLGLRDRYPISPETETQDYLQWGMLILYMAHFKVRIPERCGTAFVFVLLPYGALWDWMKAVYHTATNTLPDGAESQKPITRATD